MSNQKPEPTLQVITWWEEPKKVKKKKARKLKVCELPKLSRGMADQLDVFNDPDPIWDEATFGLMGK